MEIRNTFLLIGPNRRSNQTQIEMQLLPTEQELAAFRAHWPQLVEALVSELESYGIPVDELRSLSGQWPDDTLSAFSCLLTTAALAIQQSAGHLVSQQGFNLDTAGNGVWLWYEYEHDEVGERAAELVFRQLAELEPAFSWSLEGSDPATRFAEAYPDYLAKALDCVLPADTQALINAADRKDIPWFKLERDPYKGVAGEFRIRPHGLLKLGHCGYQHIIDGTLSITHNAHLMGLYHDREKLRDYLHSQAIPLPHTDSQSPRLLMTRKALRAAGVIGYPVTIRPGLRSHRVGLTVNVQSEAEAKEAVERAHRVSPHVLVEQMVSGRSHRLLWVNGQLLCMVVSGKLMSTDSIHATTRHMVQQLAGQLGTGMLLVDIVCLDISEPLQGAGGSAGNGCVVDVDIAPRLDQLFEATPEQMEIAAEEFVDWIFPEGTGSRVPVVAITGTNGKTTTTRMTSRILSKAGRCPAMACSGGVYINEVFQQHRHEIGLGEHHRVFEYPEVDAVVLEEYFGRIGGAGFSFNWADVAMCTNVTEDHLGRKGVHNLQQVSDLKMAVVERGRHGAVLNADDPFGLSMALRARASKVCLTSRQQSMGQLRDRVKDTPLDAPSFVVVEDVRGEDWMVFHDGDSQEEIMRIHDIPAVFNGAAVHNICNALQAAAACLLLGIRVEHIRAGLASFRLTADAAPARQNVYDQYPFTVVADYAHNRDGYRLMSAFVDRMEVSGRKVVAAAIPGDRREQDIVQAAVELAGHFDEYVCRNYSSTRGREPEEVPALMKQGLLSAGVAEDAIRTFNVSYEGLSYCLETAQPGDLVVLLLGDDEIDSFTHLLQSGDLENIQSGAPRLD